MKVLDLTLSRLKWCGIRSIVLAVSKVEQMESELRKLSQAELRQIREWLDDFIEDELEFTAQIDSGASTAAWKSLRNSKTRFSGQNVTWPMEKPRVCAIRKARECGDSGLLLEFRCRFLQAASRSPGTR